LSTEYKRMRQIVGTSAEWLSNDIVLGKGEMAIEQTGTATKIKIGDGSNKYSALPFVSGGLDLSAINANFVNLAGSTMTGPLVLSGAPTADLHAATKKYADSIMPHATGASQILVSGPATGFPWQVGDLDEGRY